MSNPPDDAQLLRNAIRHHNAGLLGEAETIYRQILLRNPNQPDALHLIGIIAGQRGQPQTAAELIRKAIALSPNRPLYYQSLAETYGQMGMLDEAAIHLQRALDLNPTFPIAIDRMGNLKRQMGRMEEALALFTQYTQLLPQSPEGHNNVGVCLKELGRSNEAAPAHQRAIQLKPDFAEAHNNLGVCFHDLRKLDEAVHEYQLAIRFKPDFPEAHNNLGAVQQAQGFVVEAIASFRKAIELRPDFAGAHYNLSLALLLRGEFSEGWTQHEWRWQARGFPSSQRKFTQPQWNGEDLRGRTILLHCEQGFGDSIQFIRYVPLITQRGARIILWPPPELFNLFKNIKDIEVIMSLGDSPSFDSHCPLMTLPKIFATRLESIPAQIPYLASASNLLRQWQDKLATEKEGLKVGLAWAGRPTHPLDRLRSLKLEDFSSLAEASNFVFYSLQKGEAAAQGSKPPPGMKLIDLIADLSDFADTAALISNLDLVITIDSAIAHLAGALGKPVWLLLPFAPDWRWLLDREDSPWYPTMRLFRQPVIGDWKTPFANVFRSLAEKH